MERRHRKSEGQRASRVRAALRGSECPVKRWGMENHFLEGALGQASHIQDSLQWAWSLWLVLGGKCLQASKPASCKVNHLMTISGFYNETPALLPPGSCWPVTSSLYDFM
jgi:hypothetical protein